MSKNKEINPKELILCLLREKFLISFLSILCASLFFLYSINSKQDFETTIIVKDPEIRLFEPQNSFFYNSHNQSLRLNSNNFNYQQPTITKSYLQSQFILSFYLNLKSIYNFNDFLNKNNNYEKFYKSKNITLEKYFYKANFSDFKNKEKNNNLFVFRFIFPEDFPGNDFFKDYIEFTKNKTIVMFKSEIKETLVSAIDNDQKIIDAIKIKNNADYFVSTSFSELTMRIEQNKILNIDLISKNFDYNAFLQKPSKPAPVLRYYKLFYSLLGLSLGFFLSLIIVYVKNFKVLK